MSTQRFDVGVSASPAERAVKDSAVSFPLWPGVPEARGLYDPRLDKDFVRRWVSERCDPYRDPIPAIPPEVILEAARIYVDVFETITGESFVVPPRDTPILDRIRANLARYL